MAQSNVDTSGMYEFVVIYSGEVPQYFQCWAESELHAKEQCKNAEPNCMITSVEILVHGHNKEELLTIMEIALNAMRARDSDGKHEENLGISDEYTDYLYQKLNDHMESAAN